MVLVFIAFHENSEENVITQFFFKECLCVSLVFVPVCSTNSVSLGVCFSALGSIGHCVSMLLLYACVAVC